MHSYIGGVRDKNIGFARIEVRGERLSFNISIRGMYAGASGTYGIYLLVDKKTNAEDEKSSFNLLKISEMNIYIGAGQCNVMVNPEDIIGSAYNYDDIEGMAIKADNQSYYAIFSLWNDGEIDVNKCSVLPKEHKKNMKVVKVVNPMPEIASVKAAFADTEKKSDTKAKETKQNTKMTEQETTLKEKAEVISFPLKSELSDREDLVACEKDIISVEEEVTQQEPQKEEYHVLEENKYEESSLKNEQQTSRQSEIQTNEIKEFEELFINADIINVFSDDDLYDCIEVTPQQIEKAIGGDEIILGNSFLIHGYYNFKHILFGRVEDNDRHTKYFIGVPGIYCNRERYMASMFGFVNFKKSHRSDYANPHFGYWYQEI